MTVLKPRHVVNVVFHFIISNSENLRKDAWIYNSLNRYSSWSVYYKCEYEVEQYSNHTIESLVHQHYQAGQYIINVNMKWSNIQTTL